MGCSGSKTCDVACPRIKTNVASARTPQASAQRPSLKEYLCSLERSENKGAFGMFLPTLTDIGGYINEILSSFTIEIQVPVFENDIFYKHNYFQFAPKDAKNFLTTLVSQPNLGLKVFLPGTDSNLFERETRAYRVLNDASINNPSRQIKTFWLDQETEHTADILSFKLSEIMPTAGTDKKSALQYQCIILKPCIPESGWINLVQQDVNAYKDFLKQIIRYILEIHKKNVFHLDLQKNNIVKCDKTYMLIDYGSPDVEIANQSKFDWSSFVYMIGNDRFSNVNNALENALKNKLPSKYMSWKNKDNTYLETDDTYWENFLRFLEYPNAAAKPFQKGGTRKPPKILNLRASKEMVILPHQNRPYKVYVGPRGGKYIKRNGVFVLVSTLLKNPPSTKV